MDDETLFAKPRATATMMPHFSPGGYVLRSAGSVEQLFGGITTKLWDDPFEWTLPEAFDSSRMVIDYLNEVETERSKAMSIFVDDGDLRLRDTRSQHKTAAVRSAP